MMTHTSAQAQYLLSSVFSSLAHGQNVFQLEFLHPYFSPFFSLFHRLTLAMAARGETWGAQERLLLLQIWRDDDVEGQLADVHHNQPVYDQVATRLNETGGFNRTGTQCRSKIKALRAKSILE